MTSPWRKLLPAVGVALALMAGGCGDDGEAATSEKTFTLFESAGDFATIDNEPTKKGAEEVSVGDEVAFNGDLMDEQKKKTGTYDGHCVLTQTGGKLDNSKGTCTGTFVLSDGTLTVSTYADFAAEQTTLAIVGGTGAYEGASGSIASSFTEASDLTEDRVKVLLPEK